MSLVSASERSVNLPALWSLYLQGVKEVVLDPDGIPSAPGIFSYFCFTKRDEAVRKIALALIENLSSYPRSEFPHLMARKQVVCISRLFRKAHPDFIKQSEIGKELKKQELLTRLCLTNDQLKFPVVKQFFDWAAGSAFRGDAALARFQHKITVLNNDVEIDTGSRSYRWSSIALKAHEYLIKARAFKEPWRISLYNQDGPCFRDVTEIPIENPVEFMRLSNSHNPYVLRLNVFAPKNSTANVHMWYHLETPWQCFSFTVYRPHGIPTPCIEVGKIAHGPVDDIWPDYDPTATLEVEVTPEQHQLLMKFLLWLSLQPAIPFHNYNRNCTTLGLDLLSMIGIYPPTFDVSFWRVYAPKKIVDATMSLNNKLPVRLQRVTEYIAALFGNIITLCYGAQRIDPRLENKPDPLHPTKIMKPHISSLKDLLDPQKMRFQSPYFFNEVVIKPLEQWRNVSTDRRFKVPQEWRHPRRIIPQFEEWLEKNNSPHLVSKL